MIHQDKIVCSFFGHRFIPEQQTVAHQVERWLSLLAASGKPLCFLNGGMGAFDMICRDTVCRLKEQNPQLDISQWLVIPYITSAFRQEEESLRKIFDKIITPNILKDLPHRDAIPARNQWMADQSDFVTAYITHPSGGAYQAFRYAMQNPDVMVVQIGGEKSPAESRP